MFCKSAVLTVHCATPVEEAMLPNFFDDTVAQSWLDAGNTGDPLSDPDAPAELGPKGVNARVPAMAD